MPPLLTGLIMAYGLWGGLIVRLFCAYTLLALYLPCHKVFNTRLLYL